MTVVTPQPVRTGEPITWEIAYQCSSLTTACADAEINVDTPPSIPSGVDLSQFFATASGSPDTVSATASGGGTAKFVFTNPLPAGRSGTVRFTNMAQNLVTPDGSIFIPVATFTATNADPATASAPVTVTSRADIALRKYRGDNPDVPPIEPALDTDVTYTLEAYFPSPPATGLWCPGNLRVTDVLPLSPTGQPATFVSGNSIDGPATYNAATNTVSWPAGPPANSGQSLLCSDKPFGNRYILTVRYPAASGFVADSDTGTLTDDITNNGTVLGALPNAAPGTPDLSATASVTHGFNAPVPSGVFDKRPTFGNTQFVERGQSADYSLHFDNTGNVPMDVDVVDYLPCQFQSPEPADRATCASPGFQVTSVSVNGGSFSSTVSTFQIDYTTNQNNTGTVIVKPGDSFARIGLDDETPRTLNPGEFVSHMHVVGTVPVGFEQVVQLRGVVPADLPADNPALPPNQDPDTLRNCAQGVFTFNGQPGFSVERCGFINVLSPFPQMGLFKYSYDSVDVPGGVIAWQVSASNGGSGPLHPVVTDLLPPQLRYEPGSLEFYSYPAGGEQPRFVVIENYNGTGRQLLRWDFPGGRELLSGENVQFNYLTRIQPGVPQGGYTNEAQGFDAVLRDVAAPAVGRVSRLCGFGPNEIDTDDRDGDLDTTETRCRYSASFTVVEGAALGVLKAVRGDADPAFRTPPAVAFTGPGQPATYRVNFFNPGNVALQGLVLYDILPYVGDTGSGGDLSTVARGSQFEPILTAPVIPPAGVTVEYSTSRNPCRGEVFAPGGSTNSAPAGCDAGTFSATAPADLATVASLRFVHAGILTTGQSSPDIFIFVEAPEGADAASGIAWNSAAISGQRADNNTFLLPTEPPRVGLAAAADLTIDKSHTAPNFVLGQNGTFTIAVQNNGPSAASGITTVTDVLPTGLTFVSATGAGWACSHSAGSQTFSCITSASIPAPNPQIPNDPAASYPPITLVVAVGAGAAPSVTNVVDVTNQSDDDTTNNHDEDTVPVLAVLPTIVVDKTASPLTRPEPGGAFTFNVVVTNTSINPVTITTLTDDIYGNIATQGTCTTAVATLLAADPDGPGGTPGGSYSCAFTGNFTGDAGDAQTDIVTATAVDAFQNTATDTDDAIVTLTDVPPTVLVDKTASPPSLPEPGGVFTFTVLVTNTSNESVTITSLTDDIYGDIATQGTCASSLGTVLAADPDGPGNASGGTYQCTFPGTFLSGTAGATQTDIVTVVVTDDDGSTGTDTDDAIVTVTDVAPSVLLDKTAAPAVLDEPGGTFTFSVVVTNTSNEAVTITMLTDDIYGNVATQGTCTTAIGTVLVADPDGAGPILGGVYSCSFPGDFTGNAGDAQTDVVTVVVTDDEGTTATDDDDATVTLTDAVPAISVDKTAAPNSLPEPGGTFTFSVAVTNTGPESVTITALTDDIYGDLVTLTGSTCGTLIGTVLAVGATSPACTFPGDFTGNAGDAQTDVVTATAVDDDDTEVTDDDDATVTLTDVAPSVLVDKTATPLSMSEPGGTFTFNVVVTNTSAEPVTITSLSDDIYGNIATQGTCTTAVGTLLAADPDGAGALLGGVYSCAFAGDFTGNAGDAQTDVVTVVVTDDDDTTATDNDDAVVTLTDVAPTVLVDKTATPVSLPEPGGSFTFNVVVTNTSAEPVTITTLTDDIYGNIATQGTCTTAVGTVLTADPDGPGGASGGTYSCSFPGDFTGNAGDAQTDVVTVVVTDDDNTTATDNDDATVTLTDVAPTVLVDKTATPAVLDEPGGTFTFNVVVTNTSNEPVTITTLTDDIYGNIATQGTCTTAVGTLLAADPDGAGPILGGVYSCSFPGDFTGNAGDAQTDVVTVVVTDDDDTTATDNDDATVTIRDVVPAISVDKTATPLTLPEPGGTFTFSVAVTNTGPESVTITALTDDIYGNIATRAGSTCDTLIGITLAIGETSPTCSFPGDFIGNAGESQTDIVTAIAVDDDDTEVTDDDDATVTLTDVAPSVLVDKTATPLSLPEPGGTFTFNVVVTNTSNEPVTITELSDDIYGDLDAQGSCDTAIGTVLAADPDGPGGTPGGSYTCAFTGDFTGNAGDAQTDVVTVVVTDDDDTTATDNDDATVTLTDVAPSVLVDKTATPLSMSEPGGSFTFNVVVTNTSAEPVTITSLSDDIYGNIATQGTCTTAVGTLLAADPDGAGALLGGVYSCAFAGDFTGNAGDAQTDVVTVVVTDDDDTTATDNDDAVVTLTDVAPTVLVDKTATPVSLPEPGGSFTFNVVVTNTSAEPVTITTLTDDIYGNIATQGTCTTAVGTVLTADPDGPGGASGGTYSCSFPGDFTGNAGDAQTDVVTVVVTDDDNTTATDNDDATVTLTDVAPTVLVDKTATPAVLDEPGGTFTFNVVVTNTSNEPVTITTLTDDIYGNIATQGTCTTAVGTLLAADPDGAGPILGGVYSCSFPGDFTGNAGDAQTDVVTVVVTDDDDTTATDNDDATVTIRDVVPAISVDKTATPLTLPEPGGTFTFSVAVTNTGPESVTITALTDDIYGNIATRAGSTCDTLIGITLAIGETSPTCSFPGDFIGNAGESQTDIVTAIAVDDDDTSVTDTDDAVVSLTDVAPTVLVDKTATPLSMPEPGGSFTFNVVVTNTSNEPVRITTLADDIYGNIATQGTCTTAVGTLLAADPDGAGPILGGVYSCSFPGDFTGNAGDAQTDVVTVVVTDDDNTTATDSDDATVELTDVLPVIVVEKTATPLTMAEPGGTFTFDVVVTNTSTESVTITELTDDIYGNIATQGSCTSAVGTVLAPDPDGPGGTPGGSYACAFDGEFTGVAGQTQTDIVTAVAVDDDDNSATDSDDAIVTLTPGSPVAPPPVQPPPTYLGYTGSPIVAIGLGGLLMVLAGSLLLFSRRRWLRSVST